MSVITSLSHGDSNKFVNAPFQLVNRVLSIPFTKSFNNDHRPSSVKIKDLRCLLLGISEFCLKRIETSIDFLKYHHYSALQLGIW